MGNEKEALRRKIERLEAILATITRLPDIARNDRPPTIDNERKTSATGGRQRRTTTTIEIQSGWHVWKLREPPIRRRFHTDSRILRRGERTPLSYRLQLGKVIRCCLFFSPLFLSLSFCSLFPLSYGFHVRSREAEVGRLIARETPTCRIQQQDNTNEKFHTRIRGNSGGIQTPDPGRVG